MDASDIAIGSVLLQEDHQKLEHPIGYFSRKLNKHQKSYSTIEKECLALILSLEHFVVYVGNPNMPVIVYTDHNPLKFLQRMKCRNQRLLRWCLSMSEYNMEIRHIKGKDNLTADALSRISL